ncbi:MAG: VWA domain-containing protein [Deltaproteobacteria bacterium]|nr:VWA domain-containing protein [Deltaproteobacteria bacterium]
MLRHSTIRLMLITSTTVLGTSLLGCGQAQFGGKDASSQGSSPRTKGADNRARSNGAVPNVDANAYGTPATNDAKKPGWVEGQPLKSLIDSLFAGGGNPTLGGSPLGGKNQGGSNSDGMSVGGNGGNDSSLANPGPNGSLFSDASGVLWLPCVDQNQNQNPMKSEFFAKEGSKVRVAGELCPQVKLSGDLNVLFVIDRSGSMEGAGNEGPNDKTSGGSCGRLRAAQVLTEKFKAMTDTTIKSGVVTFATQARTAAGMAPIAQLPLTSNVFCGSDFLGSTNYQAAFSEASSVLSKLPGKKLVYFISDGSPTAGSNDPRSAGLQAAQALRQIPDVTLFALFVGYNGSKANNPQGYLEQITGDPKLVRVTANAQELVQAAAALGQPTVDIKKGDMTAELTTPTGTVKVGIERLEPSKTAINRYYWTTEPFELAGEVGKPSINSLTVIGKTSVGTTVSATSEITYNTTAP